MSEESNESTGDKIQSALEDILGEMQTMVGEIRLKAHLASMDAKTKWDELEPKFKDFERQVEGESEKATEELHSMGDELKVKIHALREKVKGEAKDEG